MIEWFLCGGGMAYFTIGQYFPKSLQDSLFGKEEYRDGSYDASDPDWRKWEEIAWVLYSSVYSSWIDRIVNASGYSVMKRVNLRNARCLEIGPGTIAHRKFWNARPDCLDLLEGDRNGA